MSEQGNILTRVCCFFQFLLKSHTFSHTILSPLTTECAVRRALCMTNADCSVQMLYMYIGTRVCYLNVYSLCGYFYIIAKLHDVA